MADMKVSLLNQIEMLEKVQQKAFEDNDMAKVQEIAHTIITITNMLNGMK